MTELDEKALEAAHLAYNRKHFDMTRSDPTEEPEAGGGPLGYAIRAYLSSLTNASGDDEAPVATWKRQENGNNWLNIHDKALFQSSSNAEIPLFAQPQPATSGDDEEVGEQWCALENGHQTTSWKPVGFLGDKSGWDELAKRNPERYQVVVRKVFARPQSAAVRDEHVEPADPWLSIDSAPKDGTRIVGWGNGEARVTTHERYREGSIGHAEGRQDTWWEYIERETCFHWAPTHWIPLPPAPALHSTQEG